MKALTFLLIFNLINLMNLQSTEAQVTQEWAKVIVPPGPLTAVGNAIALDNTGSVYSVGDVDLYQKIVLVKYNPNGDTAWTKFYNNGSENRGHDVAIDNSGNIYVTGMCLFGSRYDGVIIKYNSNGDSLWVRRYDRVSLTERPVKIKTDELGNIFVAGYFEPANNTYDYFIVKYNSNGVFQWDASYGLANAFDLVYDLFVDKSGNSYITGVSATDIVTIKYNPAGTQQWLHRYAGSVSDNAYGFCVKADLNGNVYVCGIAQKNYITIKYNSTGDTLWTKMYDGGCSGNLSDAAISLAVDGSGNVYVTGGSAGCAGTSGDFATVKYNSNGAEQWVKRYYGAHLTDYDYGKEISVDASGDIYVGGVSYETNWQNFIIIKYDKDGNEKWKEIFGNPGTSQLNDMVIDNSGNVYATGFASPLSNVTYNYIATVKYSQANLKLTALIEGMYDSNLDKMIQDTAKVFLRNSTTPFDIIDSARSTLDSSGKGIFIFKNTTPGTSYYAVIKHRNSVETWSSSGIMMSAGSVNYDFTTSSSKAFGNNLIPKGSRFCIYSGDVTDDGFIDLLDLISISNDVASSRTGYRLSDLNGDRNTDLTDLLVAYNNSSNFVTAITPSAANPGMSPSYVEKSNMEKYSVILKDNYPNPFNPSTIITFQLPASSVVSLIIYDMTGREVATLVNEVLNAGEHTATFNASGLSSGTYFYKLNVNGFVLVKRMMLVK